MLPEIAPGCEGAEVPIATANVVVALLPHELFALTVIDPPALPTVAAIEFVVEVPDQPEGNVHV